MVKDNLNARVAIQGFVLASRSFQSVVEICRRAVNSQLTVVLFEIKLSDKVFVASINADTVVFNLGTLFRLVSINSSLDGIVRAQLEIAHGAMQRIKHQLQFEIGIPLTWLTFGNYLIAFERYNAAQNYFDYLLMELSSEHPSLPLIYNNMGLMYSEKNDNERALELYEKASKLNVSESSVAVEQRNLSISDLPSTRSSSFGSISVSDKIAEMNYRLGNRKTSLKYYRRALQIETDATLYQFYKARIEALLSANKNFET